MQTGTATICLLTGKMIGLHIYYHVSTMSIVRPAALLV